MINETNKYDDIINLERPISKRGKMSIQNRAAQFAPFSALVGYEDSVKETARITDSRKDISDGLKEIINSKLLYIKNNLKYSGDISITYFVKDIKKSGGSYRTVTDKIKKVDTVNGIIIFLSGVKIPIIDIVDIGGEMFDLMEM